MSLEIQKQTQPTKNAIYSVVSQMLKNIRLFIPVMDLALHIFPESWQVQKDINICYKAHSCITPMQNL